MIEVDNIYKIVTWFLHTKEMTHKKLQKLLYFSYGIYLYENNKDENNLTNRLFSNHFEAWVHGPVDPDIYEMFKYAGINQLHIETDDIYVFSEKVMEALNKTLDKYGSFDADTLEDITHKQSPWINARKGLQPNEPSNNRLEDKDIYLTFKEILEFAG